MDEAVKRTDINYKVLKKLYNASCLLHEAEQYLHMNGDERRATAVDSLDVRILRLFNELWRHQK